jgi:hypothetical protein
MNSDDSDFEFDNDNENYDSFREELVSTVRTTLGMALTEMDGENEVSLSRELTDGNYGVNEEKISIDEGLLDFTLEYERNSDINVGALVSKKGDEYKAVVSYIEAEDTEISDTINVDPC